LDLDIIVAPRLAQADGPMQRLLAERVELAEQRLQTNRGHGKPPAQRTNPACGRGKRPSLAPRARRVGYCAFSMLNAIKNRRASFSPLPQGERGERSYPNIVTV